MKLKKFKSILACVLVLCTVFGAQSTLAFAQENDDDNIVQENVADNTVDMADETDTTDDTTGTITDGTKDTDTTGEEVSTEDTLKSAISSATGTAESPTVIAITSDIELSTPLVIEDGKHIMFIGASDFINYESNFKIKPALTYVSGDSVNFITLGANSSVTVKNITLDADYKGRVVSIGENASFTMDKGAWITRGGLPEDSTVKLSGAGLYSWSANAVITINGGKISNCRVNGNGTGGGICLGINSDKLNMTDGLIEENTHSGVYIVKGVSGSITGGKITKNDMGVFLNTASLSFGGSIDISGNGTETAPQNLFINQGVSDKVLTIGSALENDLFFYGINGYYYNNPSTKIAQGTDNYTLTQSDFEHLKYDSGHGYVYKTVFDKDNNQILNGQHYYLSYNSRQKGDDSENNEGIYKYFPADETATVDGTIFEREGCVVSYYLIGSNKYNVGDTLSSPESNGYTLNAVWEMDTPVKNGFIFDGWYEQDGSVTGIWGKRVEPAIVKDGTTYYAKWIELKTDDISMEYGSTKALPTIADVTLSNWESGDRTIISIEGKKLKANKVGKTTITATATDDHGSTGTLTVNVEVTPMRIIYGTPDEKEDDLPYIVYSLNEDGTAPKISDILGFYPVKENAGESGTYEADTSKPKIELKPGMGLDGDVEYTYVNDVSGNQITTDTLPTHPTVDKKGNPHSIRVEMKLKNPNYRFTTIGTNWQQGDTITLFVTYYEEGMNEVDMYLEGESEPLKIFEERVYEYTGQGVVPTTKDLTTLYTKGKNTSNTITKFTAHFHAVDEDTKFVSTYLESVVNTELTAKALGSIAPKELGVYSFVINGYNKDTKTYSYVSRRYSIVKGNPKGNPTFNVIESGKSLSEVQLSGTMKNKIGETVTGTFIWENGNQTVEAGKAYKWTFTPDDINHYEVVSGESIVCPIPMEELNAIPTINASDKTLTVGDTFNPLDGVTASDKEDGDITEKVEVLSNDVDTSKAGTYTVIYKVTDSKGASSTKTITVTVKGKDTQKPTIDDNKKPSATDTDKKPASTDKQTTSNSPKTGDSTNMTTWLALMFVSLGLLAGVFTVRKSRKSR